MKNEITLFDVYDGWVDSSNEGFVGLDAGRETLEKDAFAYGNAGWFVGGITNEQAEKLANTVLDIHRHYETTNDSETNYSELKKLELKDTVVGTWTKQQEALADACLLTRKETRENLLQAMSDFYDIERSAGLSVEHKINQTRKRKEMLYGYLRGVLPLRLYSKSSSGRCLPSGTRLCSVGVDTGVGRLAGGDGCL